MHEDSVVIAIIGIVELLLFASLSAVLLRRIRLPYTIGLMIIGIFLGVAQDRLGMLEPIRHIRLPPDIVLFLFVPTLVFRCGSTGPSAAQTEPVASAPPVVPRRDSLDRHCRRSS
jgi:NhaP-type Na+/H+ or K+/H+ antiporter